MGGISQDGEWAWSRAVELWEADADLLRIGPLLREAREDVDALTEALVHRCRREGPGQRSWTDIGEALGVSRQAAQKRFGP